MGVVVVSLLLVCVVCVAGDVKPSLEIAALLPSADFSSAARLVTDAINRDHSVLPDYHVELIEVITGESDSGALTGDRYGPLVEVVSALTHKERDVIGVVGPFYLGLSPRQLLPSVIEHYGVVHISGSSCPCLQEDKGTFSSVVPFDDVYISAVLNVMEYFEWKRIGVISCDDDVCTRRSRHLMQLTMLPDSPVEIVSSLTIFSELSIGRAIHSILYTDVTILVLSMYISQVCSTLCHAYWYELTWPYYAWIVYGHQFDDVLREADCYYYCDIREAVEGVLFLNIGFQPDNPTDVIVSGQTYEDYAREYQSYSNFTFPDMSRANLLYDSVWALALALNSTEELTNASLVKDTLSSVAFAGASGSISLSASSQNFRRVDIFQIQEGDSKTIGYYQNNSVVVNHTSLVSIPYDSLPRYYESLPLWLYIVLQIVLCGLIVFTAVLLVLYLCFRKEPEIKATSPYLSVLAFIGVFSLFIGLELQVIATSSSNVSFGICLAQTWLLDHGDTIILATVLVKMVRIYYIFKTFSKMGRGWSDRVLFLVIICMTFVITINDTLWSTIGPRDVYRAEILDDGAVFVIVECYIEHPLYYVSIVYGSALCVALVVVAIMTRKIRRKHFKDTKKTNLFVVSTSIFVPIIVISSALVVNLILYTVLEVGSHTAIGTLFVALFVVPKILPPLWRWIKRHCS